MYNNNLTTVGVVGLGKMGKPMAKHLSKNGYKVIGYDIKYETVSELKGENLYGTNSLTDLASQSTIVFIIVGFDDEVKTICVGEKGIFNELQPESIVVVCSTVEPETMSWLKENAPDHIHLVDAPLCRGEQAAESGELLALVGGDEQSYMKSLPMLQSFCSDVDYLGPLGAGQVAKALNNFLLWSSICANYEALKLGNLYGLNQEKLRQALLKSSGDNWALRTWNRPRNMPWAEKDMMIVLKMADIQSLPMQMAGFIKENIKSVKQEKRLTVPKSVI